MFLLPVQASGFVFFLRYKASTPRRAVNGLYPYQQLSRETNSVLQLKNGVSLSSVSGVKTEPLLDSGRTQLLLSQAHLGSDTNMQPSG